jgi:peptidoglycan L-alanyl-D-glutamate endopeptidase CwlK
MRYINSFLKIFFLVLFITAYNNSFGSPTDDSLKIQSKIPDGLIILMEAYPDYIDSIDENHLYWRDGEVMIYDDGIKKNFDEMMKSPSLKDMFYFKYTVGADYEVPDVNFDPGRVRNSEFFGKMYGNTESQVKSNLTYINWMPEFTNTKLLVTTVNGVDKQLQAVSDELQKLPPELRKYVTKTAGTFNYRNIAGTDLISAHGYGIAIDINTDYSDYWQWSKTGKYRNRIPMEIVSIFEKYGFIWGGKWYHFDTMHFEYRPEQIIKH